MTDLRILTVRQPWAWAIIHGGKDVENRTRNIAGAYRGPVAIHVATGGTLMENYRTIQRIRPDLASDDLPWPTFEHGVPNAGHVIGVLDLVDVHQDCTELVEGFGHTPTCSPWAMPGHWHLCLENPRPLAEPIPARGRLGLWRPDPTLATAILNGIGGAS